MEYEVRNQVLARWEIASEEVEQALERTVAVAFLGPPSAGKDAAIKALFGVDFGQVDPIPGSTDRVRVAAVDAEQHFLVINAPGFGDLRADVEAEARQVLDKLDLAVYVVNADGGATVDERSDLQALYALGRPTLVCINKIDLIRPHQREEFINATLQQLGVSIEDAAVTAFDPMPALSDHPIGLERVIGWIHERLEHDGKALLFAKHLRNRAAASEVVIRAAAKRAAVAGAVPVPVADVTAVTAIQVKLITDVAAIHGHRTDQELVLFILGEVLSGGSKGFVRWAVNALKAAGWIPGGQAAHVATSALGASIAGATTYGVGKATVAFLQRQKMTPKELREVFDEEAYRYHRGEG